jgi:hypothetical protein
MLKKTITYVDYDDNQRTEDFYFNLSKAEIAYMELSQTGGASKMIQKIVAEQDSKRLTDLFKDVILKSYGEKSPDGKRFIKNAELTEAFSQTEAYSDLFMELASNTNSAISFINGVFPQVPNDTTIPAPAIK